MRVPLQWLADYVHLEMPVNELARRLTMTGLKVEAIERTGENWHDVVVGRILAIERHPTSRNPLWITEVDLKEERLTIVTGAPNVRLGDNVAVVRVGGLLPHGPDGEPMVIQPRPMAGITSQGMLASAWELGISNEHSGIYILPADAPVGQPLVSFMGDVVFDIETNPNRPDTLSIIGIAREVAAMTDQQVTLPALDSLDTNVELVADESIPVDVEAPDLCPRYTALRIEGVGEAGTSPAWMASRLEAAGMRPLSLLVDITNYVMLEYGQPMHAFDARRVRGNEIIVRRARPGEAIRTLDAVERRLTPDILVIADTEGAVAIAGVMGGENSEIADDTDTVILESATFDRISVRTTAKALGLRTESSSRFEKGLPPEGTVLGARRYLQLLAQITAKPLRVYRLTDVSSITPEERVVSMPMRDLRRLTGLTMSPERAAEPLSALGFGVTVTGSTLRVEVPYWRRMDIELSADVVEEVARMVGYEHVPPTLPRRTMPPPAPLRELAWERVIGERLLAAGVNEAVTHSLTSPRAMARLAPAEEAGGDSASLWATLIPNPAGVYEREAETQPVPIRNPETRDRQVIRLTLLPGLLDAAARNLKNTDERIAFFEIARTIFLRPTDLPYERRTLGIALTGNRTPRTWQHQEREPYSFYDLKGLLEAVLERLHVHDWNVAPSSHPALHPGRAAALQLAGHDIGFFGELHPEVAERFEIADWPVQVAEVDLDTLFSAASDVVRFRPPPRYPAAYRDIAVVVDGGTPAADIVRVVNSAGRGLLESSRIFDVYAGPSLSADKKSIAIGMTFRSPGATLTQEDVADVMAGIVEALRRELEASIRE